MSKPILRIWDEESQDYISVPAIKGPKGDKGDQGTAGHIPVKGTDYWTAADKAEMVADVLAALPDGTEVSY
uniref:PROTEIN (MANNOSE-BINDING PROTEIN A), HOST DEFENSE, METALLOPROTEIN, SUGAR.9A n=1 Tax=Myoviridae sp. ct4uh47 TaxID=2825032 RepID=A0A8S5V5W2_9CAUD|nr:MAG TPA: PROTEIN (MANNOSE-BINDING PROTEIN A), HOST DEFENSE, METALLOPROTEIN, SUGAR.9A [Myoviridae sp. ct4uh47]